MKQFNYILYVLQIFCTPNKISQNSPLIPKPQVSSLNNTSDVVFSEKDSVETTSTEVPRSTS